MKTRDGNSGSDATTNTTPSDPAAAEQLPGGFGLDDAEYCFGQLAEGDQHVPHGVVFAHSAEEVAFTGLSNLLDLLERDLDVGYYFGAVWHLLMMP